MTSLYRGPDHAFIKATIAMASNYYSNKGSAIAAWHYSTRIFLNPRTKRIKQKDNTIFSQDSLWTQNSSITFSLSRQ